MTRSSGMGSLAIAGPVRGGDGSSAMHNLVPGGNPGQSLAVAEMLIGQLFLITAISKIVTVWRPSRWTAQDVASQDRGA
jgi:hypothetical protein